MTVSVSGTTAFAEDISEFEEEFTLDVRVVEGGQPASGMLLSTSNGCGSTCSGSACNSSVSYPA